MEMIFPDQTCTETAVTAPVFEERLSTECTVKTSVGWAFSHCSHSLEPSNCMVMPRQEEGATGLSWNC